MALSHDARLIDRAQRDDDVAFEQLHARHQPAILAFCRHLTGNLEDAEDAVQHTFLAAYRRLGESAETFEWRPWLFTVARNRCLTLLRARRGEHSLADPDIATTFDGLATQVERRQELRDLVRDMGRLPEPQRAALVLSQLDALSYREIGTVLDVAPEKVKALVFQARSSLASAREAREAPCLEIRHEIATARGPALRRRLLRRHVGQCEGCREFEVAIRRQRHDLGLLLPVAPSIGLGQAVFDAIGRETTTAGGGGAAAAGGVGASVGATLAAIGLPGIAKLAVVAAVVGGGASGALAADLPARVADVAPWRADDGVAVGERRVDPAVSDGGPGNERAPDPRSIGLGRDDRAGRDDGDEQSDDDERALAADGDERALGNDRGKDSDAPPPAQSDSGGHATLPPGLAKRDDLPPGLAKRDGDLPPGLAKRGTPQSGPGNGAGTPSNGNGNGGGPAGQGNGNGNAGGQGQGQGQGSNGGGTQNGGEGNGNAGGQHQGNGSGTPGGQGNGNNAGGQDQGNGNPGDQGNGNPGDQGNGNPGDQGQGQIK
jgi:RNA polymerase sigma factor (sigma-70 family)